MLARFTLHCTRGWLQRRHINFQPEVEEEIEDSSGNVYRKHVFDDLKRQGIKL